MKDFLCENTLNLMLGEYGLQLIGFFSVTNEDGVPDITENVPARTLLMIGNGGSSMWPVFSCSKEFFDGQPDPLDRWSRRVGCLLAGKLGGRVIFPFEGPPHQPFLHWAGKTGLAVSSRLSLYIHKKYGLWHAYRFALAVPGIFETATTETRFQSPCLDCSDQPCLDVCPVDAFEGGSYQVDLCVDFLVSDTDSACRSLGCEARRACPVGKAFKYSAEQARFHMDAFVKPHLK